MTACLAIQGAGAPASSRRGRRWLVRVAFAAALTLGPLLAGPLLAGPLLAGTMAGASAAPTLKVATVSGHAGLLVDGSSRSLYVLSVEKGGKVACVGGCLVAWPPLLVKDSVTTLTLGPGVKGRVGFVARGDSMKQVTFNSYPLYTYAGDKGPRESNGQGVQADGGTWYLVKADATSAGATVYDASGSGGSSSGGW